MRSCCAVYVDVGYLLAAAATRVTGSSLRRGVQTDYAALIEALEAQAEADSGLPLLRVNWYDAGGRPGGMPDLSQDEIGLLPRVKLRLGRLSYAGEQKGVDVRIGLDLAIQARQRVADVVYLVSGDDDLTEAVEEAQGQGVQVVLLVVPRHDGRPLAVSKHLAREVDRTLVIDPATIDAAVRPTALPEALVPDSLFDVEPADPTHPSDPTELGDPAAVGVPTELGEPGGSDGSGGSADASGEPAATLGAPAVDEPSEAPEAPEAGTPDASASAQALSTTAGSEHAAAPDGGPRRRRVTRLLHREQVAGPAARDDNSPAPHDGPPSEGGAEQVQGQATEQDAGRESTEERVATTQPAAPVPGSAGGAMPQGRHAGANAPTEHPPQEPAPEATGRPREARGLSAERPPSSPSPALFARRKAASLALPGSTRPADSAAPGVPLEEPAIVQADGVARQVVAAWCSSATPDALVDLRRGAPTIPAELDRALLVDLSSRADGLDLTDRDRQYVRARFWYHVGRVRPV